MRMDYSISVSAVFSGIFLGASLAASGCKSPTAVSDSAPVVTIIPDNLHGSEFITYNFKASIANYDWTHVYYIWNLGDDTITFRRTFDALMSHSFIKPGTYIVTVKAYDYFSDSLLSNASEQIIIDTARSFVQIVPQFFIGVLNANSHGTLSPFSLTVNTSLPSSQLLQFWDYGDGTTDSFKSGTFTHVFPASGTYHLRVDVYQKSGVYVGRDTATITIFLPNVALDSLKQTKVIEIFLLADSTNSIFPLQKNSPLSVDLAENGTTWNGNNFSVSYYD